jgi:hypothetical protein
LTLIANSIREWLECTPSSGNRFPMRSLWSFLSIPKNQRTLTLLGGAFAAALTAAWAVFAYVWPHEEGPKIVCAQQGGVAAGRDASGNTVTINGSMQTTMGAKPCVEAGKPQ